MIQFLRKSFPTNHPIRLYWHWIKAVIAAVIFMFPAKKLKVIGITGTDGKTTTSTLVAQFLEEAGFKVGLASTVQFKIGEKVWKNTSHKTTLGPFQLQKLLRQMVKEKCEYVIIETSSHSIAQNRIWGIPYDLACITNLSPEHLDYHKSMRAYRLEKGKLFASLMKSYKKPGVNKVSITNANDEDYFDYFASFPSDRGISFGTSKHSKHKNIQEHIYASDCHFEANSTSFTLHTPHESMKVKSFLTGDFNVENILAATSIAYSQGVELKTIKAALKKVKCIPGRLEPIKEGQDFEVYIDFAMTEDGYRKLLPSLQTITTGNLWVVFGCCGDRDKSKRARIGEACGELADRVVVCDDEPYTEDPRTIRKMILEGLKTSPLKIGKEYFEIPDRHEAIAYACRKAKAGDTVVICGMGDFEGRTFKDEVKPWSDREETKSILKALQTQ